MKIALLQEKRRGIEGNFWRMDDSGRGIMKIGVKKGWKKSGGKGLAEPLEEFIHWKSNYWMSCACFWRKKQKDLLF